MNASRLFKAFVALAAVQALAQTGSTRFTAVTDNISGAKIPVRIDVVRWSTDAELKTFLDAWNLTPAPGRGGRGGGRGGRGRGPSPDEIAPDPSAADTSDPFGTFRGGGANGNNAGAGRGGESAPKITPEASLATALGKAPTLGYVWASEVAGYAIRSAVRVPSSDGGERLVLITERRLGENNDLWKPAASAGPDYPFSVIELRVSAKGEGEGKISLAGKVAADAAAKTVALQDYAAAPVLLRSVKLVTK